jgi:hypothetical protein
MLLASGSIAIQVSENPILLDSHEEYIPVVIEKGFECGFQCGYLFKIRCVKFSLN